MHQPIRGSPNTDFFLYVINSRKESYEKTKRKLTLLITTFILTLSTFVGATPVLAEEINITGHDSGIISTGYFEAVNSRDWAIQRRSGNDFRILMINGIPAFCIEHEIHRGDGDGYTVSDINHTQRETFSRIIYHGYDNTGKTNKDYVITQSVLWDYIATMRDDLDINGSFGFQGFAYQAEKSLLWDKVNAHNNRANFHGSSITLKTGESITLTQTNNTISQSTVVAGGLDVSVSRNKLTLTAKSTSSESSRVTFKKVGNVTSDTETYPLLYSHPTLQDSISGGNPDPISFYLDVKNRT